MTTPPNHYETLGLTTAASAADIKKAYHKLALLYHPDQNKDDAAATEKFRAVQFAYEVLKDKRKRASYDALYHPEALAPEPPRGHSGSAFTTMGGDVFYAQPPQKTVRIPAGDSALNYILLGLLSLYAAALILLSHIPSFTILLLLIPLAVGAWVERDNLMDFIEDMNSIHYNIGWFAVMLWVFAANFSQGSAHVFGEQTQDPYSLAELFLSALRLPIYLFWLAAYSKLHYLFLAAYLLWLGLAVRGLYAGWFLLFLQILITSLLYFTPQTVYEFVNYYEHLFSIAPRKPIL